MSILIRGNIVLLCLVVLPWRSANASEFLGRYIIDDTGAGAASLHFADVDGDGDFDILAGTANAVCWYENTAATQVLWPKHIVDGNIAIEVLGVTTLDLDHDGDLDIIASPDRKLVSYENVDGAGTIWTPRVIEPYLSHSAFDILLMDIDGDDVPDIVSSGSYIGLFWWRNPDSLDVPWLRSDIASSLTGISSTSLSDIDGDGDSDIVVGVFGPYGEDTCVKWVENRPGEIPRSQTHDVWTGMYQIRRISVADMDSDGDPDIAGTSQFKNQVLWWENRLDEGTTWVEHVVDDCFVGVIGLASGDIDRDGDADLFGVSNGYDAPYSGMVVWWKNQVTEGGPWLRHTLDSDFPEAWHAGCFDIDFDNDVDLFVGSRLGILTAWWENSQPPIANAGLDQIFECACNTTDGTNATLDGTSSSDPDGDALTYTWTGPFAESPARGPNPTVTLIDGCPGEYEIALVVSDGQISSEPDTVIITVVDTAAPTVELGPDITVRQETPAGTEQMLHATVEDICDPTPQVIWDESGNELGTGPDLFWTFSLGLHVVTVTVTDASGNSVSATQTVTVLPVPVQIDIKPGSYPNAVNLGSNGVVPVGILSSPDFDSTLVDPDTVTLAGAGVAVRGKGCRLLAHEEDINSDGLIDLVVQVETENLDPDQFQDGCALLTGQTYTGFCVEGIDEITIVPPE